MSSRSPYIKLAILFGHIPAGVIQSTRRICRNAERTGYCLARTASEGKSATTALRSFGNYHLQTQMGPVPASLVELYSFSAGGVPSNSLARLHAISLGFPVMGENDFLSNERFYNPVITPPADVKSPLIQDWLSLDSSSLHMEDNLSSLLMDFDGKVFHENSTLRGFLEGSRVTFPGETSTCNWTSHPKAIHVKRDRVPARARSLVTSNF